MNQQKDSYFGQVRDEMMPYVPSGCETALEIGCGSGTFIATLRNKYPKLIIWGVEPNTAASELAVARGSDRIINSFIDAAYGQLPNNYFDCILFNDVLEHLPNPDETLLFIKSKLTKNGVIIGSIPNVRYYPVLQDLIINKDWRYTEDGVLDKTHLRFYTKKSFIRMIESTGLNVQAMDGINPTTGIKANFLAKCMPLFFEDVVFRQFAFVASSKI